MSRSPAVAAILVLLAPSHGRASEEDAEDYSFDVEQYEKKPFEWGGFLELEGTQLFVDRDARLWGSVTPASPFGHQLSGLLDLDARLRKGDIATAFAHLRGEARAADQSFAQQLRVLRLSLVVQPAYILIFEVGKTVARWGKGYAFNPIAFIDRPKDPGDPEEALEGFIVARAEVTKTFDGPLRTVSLALVVVPVYEDVNEDFGRLGYDNLAARLSLLLFDVDIDLVALSRGSRTGRYGLGLAFNIASNLEVHAEAAFIPDTPVPQLEPGEPPRMERRAGVQALGGARYLSPQETTYILEYYYNSVGASREEIGLFYDLLSTPPLQVDVALLDSYRAPFPMRHYVYARVSQKDPFGILDVVPSVIGIVNLEDGSFTATPELLYKGVTDLELRLRGTVLVSGSADTDFGERPNDARIEVRARYFF